MDAARQASLAEQYNREEDEPARGQLFGAVSTSEADEALAAFMQDPHAPRIAAHFAILDEAPRDVGLDVDLDVLAAVGTAHRPRVVQRATLASP